MNRYLALSLPLAVISYPAAAAEDVLFAAAPDWVAPVDIDAAMEEDETIVLYDRQLRLADGMVTRYTDAAFQIRNTQELQQRGTLQFSWTPDKGDLTIHRLELYRDGSVIDLVANGIEPQILRREQDLEKRSVDGMLTAAFAIPGMKIGDVLRMTTSVSTRDQALGEDMQASEGLVAEPTRLGFGRLRVSWPTGADIHWGALGDAGEPAVTTKGGDTILELAMPIAKPKEMPDDAPGRYRVSPMLQFGTFADWRDVSATMAPHFTTEGAIVPGGGIAREVERIKSATTDPVQRAALALQVVQDDISYLANGMDGGNYLPQAPQDTWDNRFGDCKAKSMLLLSMLRAMDIESDVVLVDSDFGDAVSVSQPVPGAFDHMIVHAVIGGKDYWLDGTSEGTRSDTIAEVPAFVWALPIRPGGSELVRMEQRLTGTPDRIVRIKYDFAAGVDMPPIYEVEVEQRGVMGASFRAKASETQPKQVLALSNQFMNDLVEGAIYEGAFSYDEETGVGRFVGKGLGGTTLEASSVSAASFPVSSATTNWSLDVDRARSAWRDIPYKTGGPYDVRWDVTAKLPEGGKGVRIDGLKEVDETIAGVAFKRSTDLSGRTLHVADSYAYVPTEIAPAEIPAARSAMRRLSSGDLTVTVDDPVFPWQMSDEEISRLLQPQIEGADKLLAAFGDEGGMHIMRAAVLGAARRYEDALADVDRAIELEADSDTYMLRSELLIHLGRFDEAIEAAEGAFAQAGNLETASKLATLLSLEDRASEALDILDSLGLSGDEAVNAGVMWAEIAGYDDRTPEAFERLDTLLDQRPDEVSLLNSRCWVAAIWNSNLDETSADCDRAVALSSNSAAILDSRAMHKYRKGDVEGAKRDLETALTKDPGMDTSLYLRGLIRVNEGDKGGMEDMRSALRIDPTVAMRFANFGFDTPVR